MWVLHALFWWTATGCVVFVRASICFACSGSACAFASPSFLAIVPCTAYEDNETHTHTAKCLQEDISASQTYYTRQYPPQFIKFVSTELMNQTGVWTCAISPPADLATLFLIKAFQNSVSHLMIFSPSGVCFTEWGEVSVRGKHQPAHSTSFLFNFLCAVAGLVETWGCFHSCIQLHV